MNREAVQHVYVHYPFCASKCPYCDFNSHAGREAEIDAYLEALGTEARARLSGRGVRTIYVGGGTPTHCDASRLERYLSAIRSAAGDRELCEFTVEANPGTLDAAKVASLRRAGVDRVSIGVQSLEARHLKTLGRIHDTTAAREAVALARDGGIPHLSVDMILAVPGQSEAEQERDLRALASLGAEHVSAYVLTIEDGTAFARMLREGRLPAPDSDRELAHLRLANAVLAEHGYERYEVSNYAWAGKACRHNLAYWNNLDWIGLGAGAHSHLGRQRWKNVDDPSEYVARIATRGEALAWRETAPPAVGLFESLLMGLRLVDGVDLETLSERHGIDPRIVYVAAFTAACREGLLVREGTSLRPTERGLELLSSVLRELVPDAECAVEIFEEAT